MTPIKVFETCFQSKKILEKKKYPDTLDVIINFRNARLNPTTKNLPTNYLAFLET